MYRNSDLLFVPLVGSGEIGMNANLYHYDGSWLMVDLGISFPDDSMPGIDVILPDQLYRGAGGQPGRAGADTWP